MVKTYIKDLTYPYIKRMIWISFGPCLTNIVSQFVTLELQDGNSGTVAQTPSKTLDTFYNRIHKLAQAVSVQTSRGKYPD